MERQPSPVFFDLKAVQQHGRTLFDARRQMVQQQEDPAWSAKVAAHSSLKPAVPPLMLLDDDTSDTGAAQARHGAPDDSLSDNDTLHSLSGDSASATESDGVSLESDMFLYGVAAGGRGDEGDHHSVDHVDPHGSGASAYSPTPLQSQQCALQTLVQKGKAHQRHEVERAVKQEGPAARTVAAPDAVTLLALYLHGLPHLVAGPPAWIVEAYGPAVGPDERRRG